LKKNKTQLTGNALIAFQLWDECARETLAYLRDVPLSLVPKYKPFVAQSTGVELQTAYGAYLTKRAAYQSKSPDLESDLQNIITQNTAIMNGESVDSTALLNALSAGASTANSLNTIISPAPAAATPAKTPAAATPAKAKA
jgi:hypothetical protein